MLAKTFSRATSKSRARSNSKKNCSSTAKSKAKSTSDGVLTIGENADIRGEIKTKSITVYGKVQGNITVGERCELKSRCTLQGDLKAAVS